MAADMTLYVHSIISKSCHPSPAASITLTSSVEGMQAACPGEVVTHSCTVTEAAFTSWTAAPFFVDICL